MVFRRRYGREREKRGARAQFALEGAGVGSGCRGSGQFGLLNRPDPTLARARGFQPSAGVSMIVSQEL